MKTLKDIRPSNVNPRLYDVYDLRQLAIEWIKELYDQSITTDIAFELKCRAKIDWIIYFFNIKEEELE